jgi:hypothetical protein
MEGSQPPPDVLRDMQKYKKGYEAYATCRKCDYSGAMAIISRGGGDVLQSWPAIIVGFFFGILPGAFLLAIRVFFPIHRTICPK